MNIIQPLPKNLKASIIRAFENGIGRCFNGLVITSITDTEVELEFHDEHLDQSTDLQLESINDIFTNKLAKYFEKCDIDAYYSRQILAECNAIDTVPCVQLTLTRERIF